MRNDMASWAVAVHPRGAVVTMETKAVLEQNARHSLENDFANVYAIVATVQTLEGAQVLARKMKRLRRERRKETVGHEQEH